jgi:hypothetical protein
MANRYNQPPGPFRIPDFGRERERPTVERVRPQFQVRGQPQPLPKQRTTSDRRIDMLLEAGLGILAGGAQAGIRYGTEKALIGEREKVETGLIGKRGEVEKGLIEQRQEGQKELLGTRLHHEEGMSRFNLRNQRLRDKFQATSETELTKLRHENNLEEIRLRAELQNKNNARQAGRLSAAQSKKDDPKRGHQVVITIPASPEVLGEEGPYPHGEAPGYKPATPERRVMLPQSQWDNHMNFLTSGASTAGNNQTGTWLFGASKLEEANRLMGLYGASSESFKSEAAVMEAFPGIQRESMASITNWKPVNAAKDKVMLIEPVVTQPKRPSGDSAAQRTAEAQREDAKNLVRSIEKLLIAEKKRKARGGDAEIKRQAEVERLQGELTTAREAEATATESLGKAHTAQEQAMQSVHAAGAPPVDEGGDAQTKYQAALEIYNAMDKGQAKNDYKTKTLNRLARDAGIRMQSIE